MSNQAKLPQPPYYVVCFSSQRTEGDQNYGEMADAMDELARQQPGFLGAESARGTDGFGITNSFWKDEASIKAWKRNADHLVAQRLGRQDWYKTYEMRIARVERAYGYSRED